MQQYFDTFFAYVSRIIDIPEHDRELCRGAFLPVRVPADTLLEKAGKNPQYHNFIVSGYMRKYYINDKGEEVTVDLNDGPRFFSSWYHFAKQTVSNEYLHCLTDCELLRITKPDVDRLAQTGITQKDYTIKLFNQIQEEYLERIDDLANLTAEQRYVKFIARTPNIIRHVPLKYIASWLGIKPESLSRIRREIS